MNRYRAEQTALAFALALAGCWVGGAIVTGWMSRAIDRALTGWAITR